MASSSPWRKHLFLSHGVCIGVSVHLGASGGGTARLKTLCDSQALSSDGVAKKAQKVGRTAKAGPLYIRLVGGFPGIVWRLQRSCKPLKSRFKSWRSTRLPAKFASGSKSLTFGSFGGGYHSTLQSRGTLGQFSIVDRREATFF